MKKIIHKIACWLGFHSWWTCDHFYGDYLCKYCYNQKVITMPESKEESLNRIIKKLEQRKWNHFIKSRMFPDKKYILGIDDAIYLLKEELPKKD